MESRRLGLSRQDFWGSTPRELFDEVEALTLTRRDARDRDITLAWWIVHLGATTWAKGRVPDLQGLLTARPQARGQSLAEQRAVLELLAQRLGRPLQTKASRRKAS